MYRWLPDGTSLYSLSGIVAFIAMMLFNLLQFKRKRNVIGGYSQVIISLSSNVNKRFGAVIKYVFVLVETVIMAYMIDFVIGKCNNSFGKMVGTGANYFGLLFTIPFVWFLLSTLLLINPLKQIDILVPSLPLHLVFAKLGCFCNGCCWGVDWEYGLYNYHYDHPGKQVPVQAVEALFALAIFVFLLIYRKKAKAGTVYPIYLILYSGTRFFSEFFKADYPDVLGPLKVYHILCIIGVVVGILMLLFVRHFGEKISEQYEKAQGIIDSKFAALKEKNDQKLAEKEARVQAEKQERREKAKRAREKASVKYKK